MYIINAFKSPMILNHPEFVMQKSCDVNVILDQGISWGSNQVGVIIKAAIPVEVSVSISSMAQVISSYASILSETLSEIRSETLHHQRFSICRVM